MLKLKYALLSILIFLNISAGIILAETSSYLLALTAFIALMPLAILFIDIKEKMDDERAKELSPDYN